MTTRISSEEIARAFKLPRADERDLSAIFLGEGMLPTAVEDALIRFPNDGSEAAITWARRMRPQTPHWYPTVEPEDELDPALVEAACGSQPTLTARAALYQAAGPELYSKVLAAWGCSETNLRPGTNPKGVQSGIAARDSFLDDSNKNDAALSDNPWASNFRGTDAERAAKIKFFITKGTKVADAMARAANTVVGKPLRKPAA